LSTKGTSATASPRLDSTGQSGWSAIGADRRSSGSGNPRSLPRTNDPRPRQDV
jgi:hypothetical protein